MTTSIVPSLQEHSSISQQPQSYHSQYCTLQWRRGQLLVKSPINLQQPYLPSLENEQLLVECLKHSPVTLVTIDPQLGDAALRFWADACKQAKKPIFIRLPFKNQLPKTSNYIRVIQRVIDWILALFVLLLVSPVMLVLALLMQMYSPGLLFSYEWHIGERGKLFQSIKFCTTGKQSITFLGFLMRKYGLDNLPKLFNVLRGDMSFIGSRCWTLADAVHLSLEDAEQLNKLSVISNPW
ncbi:sugar transferase [Anabaena sphaerica FACHB-251]|uniref:Sugar transferase n=1 Tax=Anabaena sphaerica FACHB-251 TaxID=2692883 RepID=A0A926ZZC4_9NOST|nr:heterocyst development glycosyltransferase HepC [Anabaena sphaerica]MBD2292504.1 sugar transferase [Anabaena sphaerica FACHB-251]